MAEKAYRLYECLITNQIGVRVFHKGVLYSFTSDPGVNFSLVSSLGDPRVPAPAPMIDRDGTWYPGVEGFDDFSFPATAGKLGVLDKPDYDYDENGLLFPQGDATEIVCFGRISSHRYLVHPDAYWFPHLHRWMASADLPVYEYRYRIVPFAGAVVAFSDWIATTGAVETEYTSGTIHQIMHFPAINAYSAGHTSPACAVDVQLRRNDDVLTGDDLVKSLDFHVPLDAPLGSGQQFLK